MHPVPTQLARSRRLRAALLVGTLASCSVQAAYYTSGTRSGSISSYASGPTQQTFHSAATAGGSAAESAVISSGGGRVIEGGAHSSAHAGSGGIHLTTEANARLHNPDYNLNIAVAASSDANASFSDTLVISAPGMATGTQALITYRINVSGSLGNEGVNSWDQGWSATSYWSFTSSLGLSSLYRSLYDEWTPSGKRRVGDGSFGSIEVTAPVTLGSTVSFSLGGTAWSSVSLGTTPYEPSSGQIAAFSDLGHTIGWGGIVSLTTTDGVAINDFTALGDSGFDYRSAYAAVVPEPAQAHLMLCGVLVLLAADAVRRRR